ncbi:iron hydrogenase [Cryphonectria parasitica EP155]|uniref:Cytosolic Fe-S cluster assembly factor NAR1 n=1 Tax=Cryphonectria parasitica (strain ATCC 38755 / EP155) TaxID=660469 RepID=A0A9P5CKQ8_CRYP1|nr:iron hydrogenase [Cryphonectria parasitica EP155]KAF3762514.1 iron hydrogenase [Cryphonectria parasitica EP155]
MSAILSADDLNDFISPSVACIKPIESLPAASNEPESLETEVILGGQQQQSSATNGPSKISLTDCLACSGCVTSAEAVLVSLQSHNEVLGVLDSAPALRVHGPDDKQGSFRVEGLENPDAKLFVASVSPQTRASLAAACGGGTSEREAGRMIETLLRGPEGLAGGGKFNNGFAWVVDTNTAREACLVLGADEVREGRSTPARPILTSSCPGWICYAEKTHPHVLPHLSKVKSPQALMGTLLKTTLSKKLGISPDRIWHLAVMPCLDKKLEASREELTDSIWAGDGKPGRGARDVDCVITSKEILMLTESRGLDFFSLPKTQLSPQATFPDPRLHNFLFPRRKGKHPSIEAGSSGGNLHFILQDTILRHPGSRLQTVRGRNADVVEYNIISASGDPVFKAAKYYGFRNIQNIVRKLKPAKASKMPGGRPFGAARKPAAQSKGLDFGYVEVMACPGGCTNGGGQVKVSDPIIAERKGWGGEPSPQEQRDWLAQVDEAYFSMSDSEVDDDDLSSSNDNGATDVVDGISLSYVRDTLAHWSDTTGIDLARLVHTSYREVISDVGKDTSETQRVLHLAGKIGGGW